MTHLRKMMLEELERRNYSDKTIRYYVRFVERFAHHFGKSPDKLGLEHVRSYQAYLLKQRRLSPRSVENHVAALRFFFVHTLGRHGFYQFLPYPKVRRKLPNILSREEVAQLIQASSSLMPGTGAQAMARSTAARPAQHQLLPRCLHRTPRTQPFGTDFTQAIPRPVIRRQLPDPAPRRSRSQTPRCR